MLVNILILRCAWDDSNHRLFFYFLGCLVQFVIWRLLDKTCLSTVALFLVLELDPISLLTKSCFASWFWLVNYKLLVHAKVVPVAITFEDPSPVIESVCKIRIFSNLSLLVSLHDFRHPLVEFSENWHALMWSKLLFRLELNHYDTKSLMILRLISSFYFFCFRTFFWWYLL